MTLPLSSKDRLASLDLWFVLLLILTSLLEIKSTDTSTLVIFLLKYHIHIGEY